MISTPKPAEIRKSGFKSGLNGQLGHKDALKSQRLAHEEIQKSAGLWGEMSVGVIERGGTAFVHVWKGASLTNVYKLAAKRPKEIPKEEHDALCAWLKAGRYEGFKHTISASNVSPDEASRCKLEVISGLAAAGTRIVNPAP